MSTEKPSDIPDSEITPQSVYLNRRNFMRAGILAASVAATGWAYRKLSGPGVRRNASLPGEQGELDNLPANWRPTTEPEVSPSMRRAFRVDEPMTSLEDITHYNNFYEFSTDKAGVADAAAGFITRPWAVSVTGFVRKPKVFDLDDLLKISPPEQRVYRMRCVEGWSMVIPWNGFSLSKLLDRVEPLSHGNFVAFQSLLDPKQMPNQNGEILMWPYIEGLRMDEAMHPLTMLATGIYGKPLPPQDGAPVRLVVPWKYGFKGIKSIVKIEVTAAQPSTTWSAAAPDEYGFYANVNPNVDHPRWSQATENRIGEFGRRPTLMFNGYEAQVASMYTGLDLRTHF